MSEEGCYHRSSLHCSSTSTAQLLLSPQLCVSHRDPLSHVCPSPVYLCTCPPRVVISFVFEPPSPIIQSCSGSSACRSGSWSYMQHHTLGRNIASTILEAISLATASGEMDTDMNAPPTVRQEGVACECFHRFLRVPPWDKQLTAV